MPNEITESGIKLVFPDRSFFRFQDCEGYKKLSGAHFKEMDAGWFDGASGFLFLVELKEFGAATLAEEGKYSMDGRVWDLVNKSVHSCLMLNSILLGNPFSAKIAACLPETFRSFENVWLVHVLNISESQKEAAQFIRDAFRARMMPYRELFDLKKCSVMTLEQASARFDWIRPESQNRDL